MSLAVKSCLVLAVLGGIFSWSLCLAELAQAQDTAVIEQAQLATVHVYRAKSLMGMGVYFDVYAGGEKVCHLPEGQYCTIQVPPGEVEIWSKFMTKGAVTLDVQPLKEYYVKASVTKGFFLFWRPHLVEVMERVGKNDMSQCERVGD